MVLVPLGMSICQWGRDIELGFEHEYVKHSPSVQIVTTTNANEFKFISQ